MVWEESYVDMGRAIEVLPRATLGYSIWSFVLASGTFGFEFPSQ